MIEDSPKPASEKPKSAFARAIGKLSSAICIILKYTIIFVLGAIACKYLAPDYQIGSAAKLDNCAKSQNVYRCVLVAVEDERN